MDNKILQNFVLKIIILCRTILKGIKHLNLFKYTKHYPGTLDAGAFSILWELIYLRPVLIPSFVGKNNFTRACGNLIRQTFFLLSLCNLIKVTSMFTFSLLLNKLAFRIHRKINAVWFVSNHGLQVHFPYRNSGVLSFQCRTFLCIYT